MNTLPHRCGWAVMMGKLHFGKRVWMIKCPQVPAPHAAGLLRLLQVSAQGLQCRSWSTPSPGPISLVHLQL